jgi:hypothetical protein
MPFKKMVSPTAVKLVPMDILGVKAAVILAVAVTKVELHQLPSLCLKGVGKEDFPTPLFLFATAFFKDLV